MFIRTWIDRFCVAFFLLTTLTALVSAGPGDRARGGRLIRIGPDTAITEGRFVIWTTGTDKSSPVLIMGIEANNDHSSMTMILPNQNEEDRKINLPMRFMRLGDSLKIGDQVRVIYEKQGRRLLVDDVRRLGERRQEELKVPFTFVQATTVKVEKEPHSAIIARRGKVSWTFLLPNQKPANAAGANEKKQPVIPTTPNPDPKLVATVKEYKLGDEIDLDYSPKQFMFYLESIQPHVFEDTAQFQRVNKKAFGRDTYQAADVLTPKRKVLSLLIPPAEKDPAVPNADLLSKAGLMKPNDKVVVQYFHKDGKDWLVDIRSPLAAEKPQTPPVIGKTDPEPKPEKSSPPATETPTEKPANATKSNPEDNAGGW